MRVLVYLTLPSQSITAHLQVGLSEDDASHALRDIVGVVICGEHVGQVFRRYMVRILAEVAMIMKSTKLKVRANCMKRVFVECVATVDRGHERWLKCFSTALSRVLRLSVEVRASWLIRLESCEG